MDKTKSLIILLVSVIIFLLVFFGVFFVEEKRFLSRMEKDTAEAAALDALNQTKQAYYQGILEQKAALQAQMIALKQTYEDLKAQQPDLVAKAKTQQTQTVEQTVPVQYTVPVATTPSTSGSSSTTTKRTTKTS
jgi:hypothetical protein